MDRLHNLKALLVMFICAMLIIFLFSEQARDPVVLGVFFTAVAVLLLFDAIKTFKFKKYKAALLIFITDIITVAGMFFIAYVLISTRLDEYSLIFSKYSVIFYISLILGSILKSERFKA